MRADIQREIARADLEGNDPQVQVADGVARLTGQVASAWEWRDLVERIESVEGVQAVDADLEVAEPESMDDLVEGIRNAVLRYPYYTVFDDINFGMEEPYEVILLGAVTEPFKKTEIEKRVAQVFGVRRVDNRIEVLPLSPNDQDIRRALFYRIYRDPRFSDRANQINPPIHLVVSRGGGADRRRPERHRIADRGVHRPQHAGRLPRHQPTRTLTRPAGAGPPPRPRGRQSSSGGFGTGGSGTVVRVRFGGRALQSSFFRSTRK